MPDRHLKKLARVQLYEEDYSFLANDVADQWDILENQFTVAKGEIGERGEKGEPGQSIVGPQGPIGKPGKDGESIVGPAGRDGKDGVSIKGPAGNSGKDGSPDTAQQIKEKLHSLADEERLDAVAIKGLLTAEDVVKHIKGLKGKERLGKEHLNMPEAKPLDQRWHGAGLQNSDFVDNEVVEGGGNDWALQFTPYPNSQHIYANGQRLTPVVDYIMGLNTFITVLSWEPGSILGDYRKKV